MAWNQNDDYFDAYGFLGQPQRNDNPYSNTYNSEWRDHHDFGYEDHQMHWPTNQDFPDYQQFNQSYPNDQEQGQSSNSNLSLEDMFKSFMTDALQFQQETNANIQRISAQVEQLKVAVSQLEVQSVEELPSHTVVDQEEDDSEIVLSSGKEIETPNETTPTSPKQDVADNINTEEDNVYVNNGVLSGDETPKVEEVVESTEKENLDDANSNSLGLTKEEEIEPKQDLTGAKTSLNSLPLISDKNSIFYFPLPVTHIEFLSFVLKDSISYDEKKRCNLLIRNAVMDGVRKIHEIGVT